MSMKTNTLHRPYSPEFSSALLDRFLRYAKIGTPSDRHAAESRTPSSDCQWELIRLLEKELREIGLSDVTVDERGFLVARLPSNLPAGRNVPCIGFMAHVDTASDAPGTGVKPLVHSNYDGRVLELGAGVAVDPSEDPTLLEFRGDTIVTSDGTTLLGADDKSGVAAIVSAVSWLHSHPGIPRGEIEVLFTPDEETGKGMDHFPFDLVRSKVAYTLDGSGQGTVEAECFNAYRAEVRFKGSVVHLGSARGKLVNAVSMAAHFTSLLPRTESPEATDGKFGYYCPIEIKGDLGEAVLEVYLRDFESADMTRRLKALAAFAKATEASFPGGTVTLKEEKQYLNMREAFLRDSRIVDFLDDAIRKTGIEPRHESIRGGTDGARLSEHGIPTPNVFAGGSNFHSCREWVPLSAMTRAAETVVNLASIWAERG